MLDWSSRQSSCSHTTWQRLTPPPPAVTQEVDRNLVNSHLHRVVITEIYQNDFHIVMLATYTMAWHASCNLRVAEYHHYDTSGSFKDRVGKAGFPLQRNIGTEAAMLFLSLAVGNI